MENAVQVYKSFNIRGYSINTESIGSQNIWLELSSLFTSFQDWWLHICWSSVLALQWKAFYIYLYFRTNLLPIINRMLALKMLNHYEKGIWKYIDTPWLYLYDCYDREGIVFVFVLLCPAWQCVVVPSSIAWTWRNSTSPLYGQSGSSGLSGPLTGFQVSTVFF